MSEYIEREAALNAIKDGIDNYYRPNPNSYSITPYEFVRRGLNIAYSIIKNQPTADVQEVRHGKWIPIKNRFFSSTDGRGGNVVKCSVCGEPSSCRLSTPYCSICGAKMDEE